jgi:LCP family protein required for cell wall assembly
MTERPGGLPDDAPLPAHLDPRGSSRRRARPERVERAAAPTAAPPSDPPSGRRGGRRLLRRTALAVVVLLVLTTVGFLGALAYYDGRIDRVPVATLGAGADPDGPDTNILLVGSDSREGLTEEELVEVRTGLKGGGNEGTLTDTIVLVHVPSGGGQPSLVSFPRDSWVDIPGSGNGRINTAYQVGERGGPGGGPATLVQTVQNLSGLTIDHYMEVGFIAFLRITDALGGVEVNLCQPTADVKAGIDLPAGEQRLAGGDALGFVRQRDGLPRGDLDRIQRQQYFLGSVARQVLAPGTLLRPDRVLRTMGAVTSSLRADEDLSTFDLARLGLRLRGAASGGLAFQTVPIADANARVGGASVVLLDEPALPAFFRDLSPQGGAPAEPPPTVQIPPVLDPPRRAERHPAGRSGGRGCRAAGRAGLHGHPHRQRGRPLGAHGRAARQRPGRLRPHGGRQRPGRRGPAGRRRRGERAGAGGRRRLPRRASRRRRGPRRPAPAGARTRGGRARPARSGRDRATLHQLTATPSRPCRSRRRLGVAGW